MLKRRPIRTKLLLALTLFSAIVLLLAFSGIWGLYQYRPVADAIKGQTEHIVTAGKICQQARRMGESYELMKKARQPSGMIEDSLLDFQKISYREFELAYLMFPNLLRQHEAMLEEHELSSLINARKQLQSLDEISKAFERIEVPSMRGGPLSSEVDIQSQLVELENLSDIHLAEIESEMVEISEYVDKQYHAWIAMALICLIIAVLMVPVLVWSFHSLVVKPFRTLLDGSRLVAGGQFDHRIDLGTGDELSELASAMNHMTDRFQGALAQVNSWCTDLDRQVQQRTREVVQNEQLASVGFLAAGVAHEINNPLASIAWSAESLQSRLTELAAEPAGERQVDDEFCDALSTNLRRIEDEAYRCKGITEKLLDFSRLEEMRRAPVDLSELVRDVVSMVGKVGKYRCTTIRVHAEEPVVAQVNSQEIRQVVLNLMTNALESVSGDGQVDVFCRMQGGRASVIVEDDGCGMTREVLQHLFEPFFTRRRDGTGTGLGLSITYRIVSQHGGSLIADSDGEGQGSRMEMVLPLIPEEETHAPPTLLVNHVLSTDSV
ncbi:MAG: ATP-binding protein [Planctomycetota bacterium]